MDLLKKLSETVAQYQPTVVFSEGSDDRIISASKNIVENQLSKSIFLVGNENLIKEKLRSNNIDSEIISVIEPEKSDKLIPYAQTLMELRPADFENIDKAKEKVLNSLYFGTLMHHEGVADIHITGAVETSADVIRAMYHIIKPNRKEGVTTSFFLMEKKETDSVGNKILFLSDCAVNIAPNPKMISRIAFQIGNIAKNIFNIDAKIALLTYSTKGSGSGEPVDQIIEAGEELKKLHPEFIFEAEMQADAAIVPAISQRKAPNNIINGQANVLIFPDLQSGNIAYKLMQHLGNMHAYGPVLVGLNKTASDLSRGCSIEDIYGTFLATAFYHIKKHT